MPQGKVLIVEDDSLQAHAMNRVLQAAGYEVLVAGDGERGIAVAQSHLPDIVLCDLLLPGLDGYGVLATLKADPTTTLIPVVLMSGAQYFGGEESAVERGAETFLTKPVSATELVRVVQERLAGAAARQNLREHMQAHPSPPPASQGMA